MTLPNVDEQEFAAMWRPTHATPHLGAPEPTPAPHENEAMILANLHAMHPHGVADEHHLIQHTAYNAARSLPPSRAARSFCPRSQ
jgi:hypothetical protein